MIVDFIIRCTCAFKPVSADFVLHMSQLSQTQKLLLALRKTDLVVLGLSAWCVIWVVPVIRSLSSVFFGHFNEGIRAIVLCIASIVTGAFAVRCLLNVVFGVYSKIWPRRVGIVRVVRQQCNADGVTYEILCVIGTYSVDGVLFRTKRLGFGPTPRNRLLSASRDPDAYSRQSALPGAIAEIETSQNLSGTSIDSEFNEDAFPVSGAQVLVDKFACQISNCPWFYGTGVIIPGISIADILVGLFFQLPLCGLLWLVVYFIVVNSERGTVGDPY